MHDRNRNVYVGTVPLEHVYPLFRVQRMLVGIIQPKGLSSPRVQDCISECAD